ncbi:MAG: hypothetical protein WC865_02790 [Bacteroidales bacterium]
MFKRSPRAFTPADGLHVQVARTAFAHGDIVPSIGFEQVRPFGIVASQALGNAF